MKHFNINVDSNNVDNNTNEDYDGKISDIRAMLSRLGI